jgi:putative exporter of polyketide antibiotics
MTSVSAMQITMRRSQLRVSFGILLCSLVFLFLTSAKLAGYRQDSASRQVASMKLSQKSAAHDIQAIPNISASSLVWLAFIAMSAVTFATILVVAKEERSATVNSWFSPYLAVRPPPAI